MTCHFLILWLNNNNYNVMSIPFIYGFLLNRTCVPMKIITNHYKSLKLMHKDQSFYIPDPLIHIAIEQRAFCVSVNVWPEGHVK